MAGLKMAVPMYIILRPFFFFKAISLPNSSKAFSRTIGHQFMLRGLIHVFRSVSELYITFALCFSSEYILSYVSSYKKDFEIKQAVRTRNQYSWLLILTLYL